MDAENRVVLSPQKRAVEMFDPRPSDEELAQVEDLASDTEWVITVLQRFEVDDDLVVDPAPETDDDRTDQWVAFLENAGF